MLLLERVTALGQWQKVIIKRSIERASDVLPSRSFQVEDAGAASIT